MNTAIVILNWNTKAQLERFLPSVIASTDSDVIVVDNGSTDGSVELLALKFPTVRLIVFDKNYGFTGGYNKSLDALKDEDYDVYVIMNTDVQVQAGWLEPLEKCFEDDPQCAACGPKLHSWYNKDDFEYAGGAGGYLDKFCYPFCRGRIMKMVEKDEGQYDDHPSEIFWTSGACIAVRSKVFHEIGGFDDRFFAHMEEIDLCWRIQLAGWTVKNVPTSVVWHVGGGTLPQDSPWKLKLNYRNNLLMMSKNLEASYGLQGIENPAKAAKKTIRKRMILDGLSAIVYLCSLKWSYFKAVVQAHNEYRSLCGDAKTTAAPGAVIHGWYPSWIIPKAVFHKASIFKEIQDFRG